VNFPREFHSRMGADTERLHPILGRFPPHIRRIPPLFEVGGWPRLNSKKRFFVAGAGGWSILKLTTVGAAPTVLVIFLLLSPALTLRLRSGQASWAKVWRASGAPRLIYHALSACALG